MSKTNRDSIFWGMVVLLIGVLFLLRNFGFHIEIWHLLGKYWPLVLIFIGLKNIIVYLTKRP
jgi:hypothetical protein